MNRNRQQGLTLLGTLFTAVVLVCAFLLALKLVPVVTEYLAIKRAVEQVALQAGRESASIREVRAAFAKRIQVDNISSVEPGDLEVDRDEGSLKLSVSYSRKVPLGYGVSLLIDFATQGSAPFGGLAKQ